MNSSYFNMISSAFLGTVFFVLTISFLSEGLFHSEAPEKEGFIIEVAESTGAPTGDEAPVLPPISPLLADASVEAGEKVFKKCAACHTVEEGGANKVGPGLWNIVNTAFGVKDGFGYSSALKAFAAENSGIVWNYENLNEFLLKPSAYMKGTAMGFAGLKKETDRANVIAYLRSLSSDPAPLPSAEVETAPEATTEAATDGASMMEKEEPATETATDAAAATDAASEEVPADTATQN